MEHESLPGTEAQWVPVAGYEGVYEVSDTGLVRGLSRGTLRTLKPRSSGPYPSVNLCRRGTKRSARIHNLVAHAFLGPRPAGLQVRHLDGNPLNNSVSNLAYGTASENALDKRRHGTDYNARKTHCPHGHAYDVSNTRVRHGTREGERLCRACEAVGRRKRRRAKRLERRGTAQ